MEHGIEKESHETLNLIKNNFVLVGFTGRSRVFVKSFLYGRHGCGRHISCLPRHRVGALDDGGIAESESVRLVWQ